jgi:toxin ParE1/3/4
MRAHFTPQAEIDLEEVGDYIALDNPRRAVSFIREIRQHCEKIADGPHHYVARPDLGDTIRICAHETRQTFLSIGRRRFLSLRSLRGLLPLAQFLTAIR